MATMLNATLRTDGSKGMCLTGTELARPHALRRPLRTSIARSERPQRRRKATCPPPIVRPKQRGVSHALAPAFPQKKCYDGQYTADGLLRHGQGAYTYPNKFFSYEGSWVDGNKHGASSLSRPPVAAVP
jgi:hypothetical protein